MPADYSGTEIANVVFNNGYLETTGLVLALNASEASWESAVISSDNATGQTPRSWVVTDRSDSLNSPATGIDKSG